MAWMETGRSLNTIRAGLKANNISPGDDGKYSTRDIVTAILGRSASLKSQADDARHNKAITEAELTKLKFEREKGEWVKIDKVREFLTDYSTQVVQFIRHSKMTAAEKQQLLRNLQEVKFKGDENTE